MKRIPVLTPVQAIEALKGKEHHIHAGFKYYMDAPQMCDDPEGFAPVAIFQVTDETFFCEGEPGDPVTEETRWVS